MATDKLELLVKKCKADVILTFNEHKSNYESVADHYYHAGNEPSPEVFEEMKKRDTIIELQFYPDSTVGFYLIYHYDLNMLLDEALACINRQELQAKLSNISTEEARTGA